MAEEERMKALDAALGQIEKQFGKGSVMRMGDNLAMQIESIRMTDPLPNCFSIWPSAASNAFIRSSSAISLSPLCAPCDCVRSRATCG